MGASPLKLPYPPSALQPGGVQSELLNKSHDDDVITVACRTGSIISMKGQFPAGGKDLTRLWLTLPSSSLDS